MIQRILFVLLLMVSQAVQAEYSSFDVICQHFEALDKKLKNEQLSSKQRLEFINTRVTHSLQIKSPAREAWEAVVYAMPDERYEMYQYTVKEITGKKWQCDAMKKLISSIGE